MRTLLMATAALALLTTVASAAKSENERVADGIATVIAYDAECAPVPVAIKRMANEANITLPGQTLLAARLRTTEFFLKVGRVQFCASMKTVIERVIERMSVEYPK
jgi:hypothetical protein